MGRSRRWAGTIVVVGALVGLAGCVGVNPEWDSPARATAWEPQSRCDAAESGDGEDGVARHHDGDGGSSTTHGEEDDEACATMVEPEACGEGATACASADGWFCADLREHDEHCGACFHDCADYGDATCLEGECYCRGGPWWARCEVGCVDTRIDPRGCGLECVDCRETFGPDARCETGICKPPWGG